MSGAAVSGPSPVARGRSHLPGWARISAAGGCCLVMAGIAAWAVWPRAPREPSRQPAASAGWDMGQAMPDRPFRALPAQPAATAPPPVVPAPAEPPAVSPVVVPAAPRAMAVWEDQSAIQQAAARAAAAREAAASPRAAPGPTSDVATPTPGGSSEYAQRMQSTRFADTAPVPHRFHVQYTIKKGTIFPCTPASPISSALPGPVQCTVSADVWSMDGTTILLPRGTQVNGTVERGLANGEERLFLVWTDALTPRPDLLAIPLDSPAADEMGQVGAPGDVNDHLWRRVRAALLLSLVDTGANVATALAQQGRGNTVLNFGGMTGTATSLGQMAFGRDLNIPSTLYRGPGQPLTVYVNHYIDLYRFYQNRVRY